MTRESFIPAKRDHVRSWRFVVYVMAGSSMEAPDSYISGSSHKLRKGLEQAIHGEVFVEVQNIIASVGCSIGRRLLHGNGGQDVVKGAENCISLFS